MVDTQRQRKRQRKDDSQIEDRISELADYLLIHILSFLDAKEAVQTCILSKRWINLWKTLSSITLRKCYLTSYDSFKQFVSMFFSLRDHSTDIHALILHNVHYVDVIEYAFSHNVQQLQIHYSSVQNLPSCFFSSHTLTSLTLTGRDLMWYPHCTQIFPGSHSFNFPALTTLSLHHLSFCCNDDDGCVDPFSTFNMLNTLIIDCCVLRGNNAQNLRISSTKLVNLTINVYDHIHAHARNTTIDFKISFGIELYAPTLHTLVIGAGHSVPKLFASKTIFSSIKHLSIRIMACNHHLRRNKSILLNLLLELANIESLTVTFPVLEVLFYSPDLYKVEFPSLCNLKLLKIEAYHRSWIPAEMVDFLLQNSPSAKFVFIKSD